jgi:hypothetical protein
MGQVKGNSMHANLNRDLGTKPVMIDDDRNLNELIDSGSWMFTSGYAKDTDLIDGTIDARFNTLTANE